MKKHFHYYWLIILATCFLTNTPTNLAQQIQKQEAEKYSRVKIYTDAEGIPTLAALGLPIDHAIQKKGVFLISDFSATEVALIKQSGFRYEIIHDDLVEFHTQRHALDQQGLLSNKKQQISACKSTSIGDYPVPEGFKYGSMAGYLTYAELLETLDSMSSQYPHLITAKTPIDTFRTHEDRPIYYLKLSDNPNLEEGDTEPEILYTALHHAREPMSLAQMIFYLYYLLENYGTDPLVTDLVDNTEMYFVPCINPDGYVYNETTNPNGFGFWRKNRRNNGNGTWGVDLNRNYGLEWAHDDFGSSPSSNSDVYRGPAPFSEPETQAIKFLCEQHKFLAALNYHAFSDLLIYPWGYIASYLTPDSTLFVAHAEVMTEENNYKYGTGNETVGYLVNGDSDDWMYGEDSTKNKILAMTPEVGSPSDGGFWAAQSNIIPLCQENMAANLRQAQLVHDYAIVKEKSPLYLSQTGSFLLELTRIGLADGGSFTINIVPIEPNIFANIQSSLEITNIDLLETVQQMIDYELTESVSEGDEISFDLILTNSRGFSQTQRVTKYFGQPTPIYVNQVNDLNAWETDTWALYTEDYVSEPACITDSPNGNYPRNASLAIQLTDTIDLTNALQAQVKFWAKWEIETGWDYVQIQAINLDNPTLYIPLCGEYTNTGNAEQDLGNPIYDGAQLEWVQETLDLSDFVGNKIQLRFLLVSDSGLEMDGFYFDDLSVEQITKEEDIDTSIEPTAVTPAFYLGQSVPNPVHQQESVSIPYFIPKNVWLQNKQSAQLKVLNTLGQVVFQQQLNNLSQQGQLTLDSQNLKNGIYYYQLWVADQPSTVRKMLVVR